MKTWNDYKDFVKNANSKNGRDLAHMEECAHIISIIIQQRNALGLSQRDLAANCGMPQSSVARIESLQTTPNLITLIKLLRSLGVRLTISK